MIVTVSTQIFADKPAPVSGMIYTRPAIEKMISDSRPMMESGSIIGGLIDRSHIQNIGEKTHTVKRMYLRGDELVVDLEIDEDLAPRITGAVAKPIIEHRLICEGDRILDENSIVRLRNVQLELR